MRAKIAVITDQHLELSIENFLNIDTQNNFKNLLSFVKKGSYDALIILGDLCMDKPNLKIYSWVKEHLDTLTIPYYIIPGNHDDTKMMHNFFPQFNLSAHNEIYYSITINETNLLFLDSSKGAMSDEQFEWLHQNISVIEARNIYIFMHHPPVVTGSLPMDMAYPFHQIEKFGLLCSKYNNKNFMIFCGHCHIERMILKDNIQVFITPSSYMQIHPDFEYFQRLTEQGVGMRELIWQDDHFFTNVFYPNFDLQ